MKLFFACMLAIFFAVTGCASDGASCTASTQGDGIVVLICEDGTTATVKSGEDGIDGRDGLQGPAGEAGPSGETGPIGPPGEAGPVALLEVTAEPIGDNCPQGGVRVRNGVDDDADNILDAEEVDQESFVCNGDGQPMSGTLEGSIEVRNAADMFRYGNFDTVTGGMVVAEPGLLVVELPQLIDVGSLTINTSPAGLVVERVSLVGLERVRGNIYVHQHTGIEQLELPSLQIVDGGIFLDNNDNLHTPVFGSLTHVHGSVVMVRNGCTSDADATALFDGVSIDGAVDIRNNGYGIGDWCS